MNVVKPIEDNDFEEYARITLDAYPAMFTDVTEERRKAWIERMRKSQSDGGPVHYHGFYKDGKLVGGMRFHDFYMMAYDTKVFVGGVGNVCVDLLHKKEHVAKEMMEYFHRYYLDKGACLVTLYPFRSDFYRKMGYGYGRKMNQYRFKPDDLPRGSKENVFYIEESDVPLLHECYNRYVSRKHGMIEKNEPYFERLLNRHKVVGYRRNGKVEGFMAFGFKKLFDDHFLLQDIEIHMFIYENTEALLGLLSFLQVQLDQVNRIVLNTHDDDFHYLLQDPRNGNPSIFATSQETNIQGVGIMYRLLDTTRFFEFQKNHSFNDTSIIMEINVIDTFLPENNRKIVIQFESGKPKIADNQEPDVSISIDVAWLSSLVMGVVDFKNLWQYGLVELSDSTYTDTLNELFHVLDKPETIEEF
jgi:predicted acetyltransferase